MKTRQHIKVHSMMMSAKIAAILLVCVCGLRMTFVESHSSLISPRPRNSIDRSLWPWKVSTLRKNHSRNQHEFSNNLIAFHT